MTDQGGWRPEVPGQPRPPRPEPAPSFPRPEPTGPGSVATPVRPIAAGPSSSPIVDPVGMQSVLTRARDQSRFEAPVIEEEKAKASFPARALLWMVVGVLVVGIVVGLVYVTFIRKVEEDPDVTVQISQTASEQPRASTPVEVVTQYFEALKNGDIETALRLGPPGGTGLTTLLTSETFGTTHEASPIDNIEVLTDDPSATEVQVRYTLAGEQVDTQVRLVRLDTGSYQLARTTVPVQLQMVGGENVPMLINGHPVDHSQVLELVPGRYELTTGLPYIAYPADTSIIVITTLASPDVRTYTVNPELTQQGQSELLREAKASLDRCLSQRELLPAGCPFGVPARRAVNRSTIQWELTNDPWRGAIPSLSAKDQSIAFITVGIDTNVTFDYADGGTSGNNPRNWTAQVSANMLGANPDQVTVIWDD